MDEEVIPCWRCEPSRSWQKRAPIVQSAREVEQSRLRLRDRVPRCNRAEWVGKRMEFHVQVFGERDVPNALDPCKTVSYSRATMVTLSALLSITETLHARITRKT